MCDVLSELRACRTEIEWEWLFQSENEVLICSIQSQLHYCSYNSMRDRVWPFLCRDMDAHACDGIQML